MLTKIEYSYLEKILLNNEISISKTSFKNSEIFKNEMILDVLTIIKSKSNIIIKKINNKNDFILQQLLKDKIKDETRINYSLFTNTHKINCSVSLITYFHNEFLKTVILNQNKQKFEQNQYCLIIENLELFVNFKYIFENNLIKNFKNLDITTMDIIYGKGFDITNKLNIDFLNLYSKIFCFFDLDKAGFDMLINLKKNIPNIENCYINNIETYFQKLKSNIVFSKNNQNINIFNYINKNKQYLNDNDIYILNLIDKYGILEQEIFLQDINK